jgi:hypothetical protein
VFGADAVNFFKNFVLFHGLQFHHSSVSPSK